MNSTTPPASTARTGEQAGDPEPIWRREPFRFLFPLGVVLVWAGVLHWLLHALGIVADYASVFHSIAQVQGFLMCFAAGFLFTAIPRLTGTAPASTAALAVAVVAPVGTTIAAWNQQWLVSQLFWFALVATIAVFMFRRGLTAAHDRSPPDTFIWIPLALGMGVIGTLLIGLYQMAGDHQFWLHNLGRLLLLQGMFIGLVLGVGAGVLPLVTRGDPLPAGGTTRRRVGHIAAAAALMLSFEIEVVWSLRGGLALRGAVVLVVLLASAALWRRPNLPGAHRRWVWLSAWMIPTGYLLAALFPAAKNAGLHVVFIGGFALMAFSVALHVAAAHAGTGLGAGYSPWRVAVFGALFLVAVGFRAMVDLDRERFYLWLGASAATFLLGTLFWAWLILTPIRPRSALSTRQDGR